MKLDKSMTTKKQQLKKALAITLLTAAVIITGNQWAFAQFIQPINPNNRFGETHQTGISTNWIRSIGIGNFTGNFAVTNSHLHVNSNFLLLPTNGSIASKGEVFRTTGPFANINAWRMFTGAGNGTQTFSITTLANTGGINITTFQNQPMDFLTNNVLRMHINANFSPSTQGFVAIGNNFSTPQSRVHINEMDPIIPVNGGTACYAQWTVTATGNTTANDGLRIGLYGNGNAEIRQQENLPLIYYTNNIETARMIPNTATTLAGNPGMMGIGDWTTPANIATPIDAKLDIDGDLRIRRIEQDNTLYKVLVIDEPDYNRVHWRDISSFTLGNICGSATPNPLTNNWEIQLPNNTAYNFSQKGVVNITDVTNCSDLSKLYVSSGARQISTLSVNSAVSGFGGFFLTTNSSGTALYCRAPISSGSSFPPTPPTSLALHADGDVFVSGTAYLINPAIISDQQFKTNIDSIPSAMEIVKQLKPSTFEYVNNPHFNFPLGINFGFVAQDVEQVIPELVKETVAPATFDTLGNQVLPALPYKTLNYQGIIPILTKAIQEQEVAIDSLKSTILYQDVINNDLQNQLNEIKACLQNANICTEGNRTSNNENNEGKVIQLENLNAIILDQSVPNPFKENTVITYTIPKEVMEAQLLFYDMNGRIIKQVDISERGEGKLTVYGENLQNGVYTYSLIADGKLITTKKMVKQ